MPRRDPFELRHNLRAIWVDGIGFSVMVGMGETYIPAFALALGLPDVASGLVATLPMLCGSFVQLVAAAWIRRVGSLKRWAVAGAALQAAAFLPLVVAALVGSMPAPLLYFCAAWYWAAGLATGPAWNAWVDTLIPPRLRIRYFARRWRALHVSVLAGVFAAGFLLDVLARSPRPLYGFALIFSFAGLARALSTFAQARQTEPVPIPHGMTRVGWRELARRFRHGNDGRLIAYMMALQFSVQTASPFFTAYMLGPLNLSYATYMVLVAAAALGKFASLPLHGWIAKRYGVRVLLWVAGLGIVPSSMLLVLSDDLPFLFFAQLYSGAAWAAYELSTFLSFFDTIPASERVSVLTRFNVTNSSAIFAGSLCGGLVLGSLGSDADAFVALFAISCALRLATILLLRRIEPLPFRGVALSTDTVAIRPGSGSFEQPIASATSDAGAQVKSTPSGSRKSTGSES